MDHSRIMSGIMRKREFVLAEANTVPCKVHSILLTTQKMYLLSTFHVVGTRYFYPMYMIT